MLEKLANYNSKSNINLSLNRIKEALYLLNNPCHKIPAIHIAGTNGKGSIASFINSVLTIVDIKTGITTSPHLVDWIERICINDKKIPIKEFDFLTQNLHQHANQ